jgi:histidinol dehydrogenase
LRPPLRLKYLPNKEYERLIQRSTFQLEEFIPQVIPIINEVKEKGDEAVLEFTQKFDKVKLSLDSLKISEKEIKKAYQKVSPSLIDSLKKMHQQVEDFHRHQIPKKWSITKGKPGSPTLGELFVPVEKAGIYVPGGKASYPSTLIMGCVPAKLAGVKKIVVCTPSSSTAEPPPALMVAFDIAGADLLINAGGAQAVAALAYGTETVPRVDLIAGPGNVYVSAAKVYLASLGKVGIDCPAGPSEVLIIADDSAPPSYVVWDLLAQAEHDELAWSILVTTSEKLAQEVYKKIKEEVKTTERKKIISSSLQSKGAIFLVDEIEEAVEFANQFAPEHLEVMTRSPERYLPLIENAGSLFLGPFSPVAAGDYLTGTNHILPTAGAARFSSGLSVHTFIKRITYQSLTPLSLSKMKEPISQLTRCEGFQAHLKSIQIRGSDLDI